jgi:hypothetical protein
LVGDQPFSRSSICFPGGRPRRYRRTLAEALPALPETADELWAIAKVLGAKSEDIKLGEAASVTAVKNEPLADYRNATVIERGDGKQSVARRWRSIRANSTPW